MVGTPVARNYVNVYNEHTTFLKRELNKIVTLKYFTFMITWRYYCLKKRT